MTTTIPVEKQQENAPSPEAVAGERAAVDRSTFSELVVAHQSGLRIFISSLGVANGSIDDVAQEALLIAYRQFDRFEAGTSFQAWIRTIARNLVLNDRRKAKRRFELLNEMVCDYFVKDNPADDLADYEESSRLRQALRLCMQELPGHNREIVDNRYENGLETKVIAEQLGMKDNAVRQRLFGVRRALKRCIDKQLQGVQS